MFTFGESLLTGIKTNIRFVTKPNKVERKNLMAFPSRVKKQSYSLLPSKDRYFSYQNMEICQSKNDA